MERIISNIEGLRNPTILQQLEAMRKYIQENAKQGARGVQGIFTVNAEYSPEQEYYAITAVRNYVQDAFVGQAVYFNNAYIGIVAQVYDSTPVASPAFTVTNVKSTQGEKGTSIVKVENIGQSQGDGFTITHCEQELTDGTKQPFDVYATDGKDGANGADGVGISDITAGDSIIADGKTNTPINIVLTNGETKAVTVSAKNGESAPIVAITDVPTTATQGTLTEEQLQTLQSDNLAAILFNNELYYPMDKMSADGYYTYVHNGYDNAGSAFAEKVIVITLSTRGWALARKLQSFYRHKGTIQLSAVSTGTLITVDFSCVSINNKSYAEQDITIFKQDIENAKAFGFYIHSTYNSYIFFQHPGFGLGLTSLYVNASGVAENVTTLNYQIKAVTTDEVE